MKRSSAIFCTRSLAGYFEVDRPASLDVVRSHCISVRAASNRICLAAARISFNGPGRRRFGCFRALRRVRTRWPVGKCTVFAFFPRAIDPARDLGSLATVRRDYGSDWLGRGADSRLQFRLVGELKNNQRERAAEHRWQGNGVGRTRTLRSKPRRARIFAFQPTKTERVFAGCGKTVAHAKYVIGFITFEIAS